MVKVILEYNGHRSEQVVEPIMEFRDKRLALPSDFLEARTVAVVRDGGLGDVIMLTAAIHRMVELYPHLRVDYYVNPIYVELFKGDPYIADCRPLQALDKRFYDLVLDCRQVVEKSHHAKEIDRVTLFSMRLIGEEPREGPRLFLQPLTGERHWHVDSLLQQATGKRVAIAPRSASPYRDWPHANELARLIKQSGNTPYIIDHHDEKLAAVPEAIPAKLDPLQIAWFLKEVDVLVSTDTGVYHVAGAVEDGPFMVVLFGSIFPPRLRMAWYKNYTALFDPSLPCLGCDMSPKCKPPAPCLANISAERVWETIAGRL